MTDRRDMPPPQRWQLVKELFGSALERHPNERAAFLDDACGVGDPDIRREVEALLAAHFEPGSFLETPVSDVAALLAHHQRLLGEGQTVGRYRILSLLGSGGMGVVYLAEDLRLGRRAAVKVLSDRLDRNPDRLRRFEQEARVASGLSHPNVCVIYEVGEADDDRHFIVMEYVPGESLRQMLERHRAGGTRLTVPQSLDIAHQVAAGLAAAHAAGIVHRDVKPENIMIRPDGLVKVLDFGLAKLGKPRPAAETVGEISAVHTEPGMVMGTVQYMSPEQARGFQVDARSDVWSLGVVLYEMLAGHPPFEGETASDTLVAVLDHEPKPLAGLSPPLPSELPRIVTCALKKNSDARYQHVVELATDLHRVQHALDEGAERQAGTPLLSPPLAAEPAAVRGRPPLGAIVPLVLVLFGVAIYAWSRGPGDATLAHGPPSAPPAANGAHRLAVLPFKNLSRVEDSYLAEGMTDEVRGKLAALPGLQVVARSSSVQYRQSSKTLQAVALELDAEYLLTATVEWKRHPRGDSARVRVRPELVRIVEGDLVSTWKQRFDAPLSGVFEMQADVAGQVAAALNVSLGPTQQQALAERPTTNLAAYDAFLKGEATEGLSIADAPSLRLAIDYYEQAVVLDSMFGLAWAQLARAHASFYSIITPSAAAAEAARVAAKRAVVLAPGRPEGHFALGDYYGNVLADNRRALAAYEAGLRVAPDNAELLAAVALAEQSLGRWEASLLPLRRAEALDPRSVITARRLAVALLRLRRYPQALAATARGLVLAPANLDIIASRTMVFLAQGDLAGARAVVRAVPPEVAPTELVAFLGNYADLYWVLDDAQQQLLLRLGPRAFGDDRAIWGIVLAQTHHLRGDHLRARAYADSARGAFEQQLRATPEDALRHVLHGLALAYLGRNSQAIAEGKRGLALGPVSRDAYLGPYLEHQLARIYLLSGEPASALGQLEPLLRIPYYLSPGWLRIDPTFAPLRGTARFERLAESNMARGAGPS